jgi:hypothetical protein
MSGDFFVMQFRVTGGETHIDGDRNLAVRLEMTAQFIEDLASGTFQNAEQVPRRTFAADFASPEQTLKLVDRITEGIKATGIGTELILQEKIPRGKAVDDLLVQGTNVQFAVLPQGELPVMRLTFTGLWVKDTLDPAVERPVKRHTQAALFAWNALPLAARLDAEARRLQSQPELPASPD